MKIDFELSRAKLGSFKVRIREFKVRRARSEMRDCSYERDTGIGNFEERDLGNNHLNEPRTGMSVDEDL